MHSWVRKKVIKIFLSVLVRSIKKELYFHKISLCDLWKEKKRKQFKTLKIIASSQSLYNVEEYQKRTKNIHALNHGLTSSFVLFTFLFTKFLFLFYLLGFTISILFTTKQGFFLA